MQPRSLLKSSSGGSNIEPWRIAGGSPEAPWRLPGARRLSCRLFGASLPRLGPRLGRPWRLLAPSWRLLGRSWRPWRPPWGAFWLHRELHFDRLGALLRRRLKITKTLIFDDLSMFFCVFQVPEAPKSLPKSLANTSRSPLGASWPLLALSWSLLWPPEAPKSVQERSGG